MADVARQRYEQSNVKNDISFKAFKRAFYNESIEIYNLTDGAAIQKSLYAINYACHRLDCVCVLCIELRMRIIMPKITLLLLATTIGIGITGAAFCVGVTYAFTQLPLESWFLNP